MKIADKKHLTDPFIALRTSIVDDIRRQMGSVPNIQTMNVRYRGWINKNIGIAKPQIVEMFKSIAREYKCFDFSHCGTENCLITDFKRKEFEKCYADTQQLLKTNSLLVCGALKIDLVQAVTVYKQRSRELPINEKFAQLLVFLAINPNKLLSYKALAQELDLNSYSTTKDNDDFAPNLNKIKSQLVDYLQGLRISETIIKNSLTVVRSQGYKLDSSKLI